MPPRAKATQSLGIEATLWDAANKLRGTMDSAEYKHVTLGLIFLKYVGDAFNARHGALAASLADPGDAAYVSREEDRVQVLDDPSSYHSAGVFWVPAEARWDGDAGLRLAAKQLDVGSRIDAAMRVIEEENPVLRGVLPKNYSRPELDVRRLGDLVALVGSLGFTGVTDRSNDVLGRVYEYFLGQFAAAESGAGEFYTPRNVVRLLVEMLEPYRGRVYDPACGSGGMFVQAGSFVQAHGGRASEISIYGQESNATTWRMAKMNLALRGVDADLGETWGDTFHDDKHPALLADFVLANPPFNIHDWGGEQLRGDPRWVYGDPPVGNANYAWLQHIWSKLAPGGAAGVVLANGALDSTRGGEDAIRRRMVEDDAVECVVALPGQLFYSTPISVCLWFLNRDKTPGGGRAWRDRRGEVLFIDARQLGQLTSRVHRELRTDDIERIASVFHAWRGERGAGDYVDQAGFCASASTEMIAAHHFSLTPGRFVGTVVTVDDGEPVDAKIDRLTAELTRAFAQSEQLHREVLKGITAIRGTQP